MTGMSRFTGEKLDPNSDAHLVQSIGDILTTPLGSRVLRRSYGSELPDLIDQPIEPRYPELVGEKVEEKDTEPIVVDRNRRYGSKKKGHSRIAGARIYVVDGKHRHAAALETGQKKMKAFYRFYKNILIMNGWIKIFILFYVDHH